MELRDALTSTGTCRFYKSDPVPERVLARVLDAARYAPSGGNRQPVRFVAVRDAAKRRRLAELYLPIWSQYVAAVRQARVGAGGGSAASSAAAAQARMVENADHFAQHLHEIPVMLVVCARIADLYATDGQLGRISIVGGASVYPAVENVLLAAREQGLGTALTTLLCQQEPAVKELLGIPAEFATAAMVTLGYPARGFPKQLRRRPLEEVAFADAWGAPLGS
ncbi:MAG TPA: nitroreductase family protein [Myxococcota bacterium]|nr:nitroreductase family protein [Myxococcota bacterium]